MTDRRSALAIGLALLVAACGGADDDGEAAPPPATDTPAAAAPAVVPEGATAEMVAQGRDLFRGTANCHACHAQDGTGTALAPNLRDDEWLNTDGTYAGIQQVIRTGVANPVQSPAPMPAMGGVNLTDDQVLALAAYVYSIGHGGG